MKFTHMGEIPLEVIMGISLTQDKYDAEQIEWTKRVYRVAKAINETVHAPDRITDQELEDLIDDEWDL